MKRTDITELFPDASKEQIDKIMDLAGADVNAAKSELQGLKDQIESMKKNMDSVNSAKTAKKQAEEEIARLQAEIDSLNRNNEIRGIREKVSGEKKIPISLLTGETEEACAQQADAILSFANSLGYPKVPDGGEPHTPPNLSSGEKFAKWMEGIL